MNDIRIIFISPYEGMKEAINNIAQNIDNIEYEVCIGNLSNLDEITRKIDSYKPDIVISRGLTADEISKRTDSPVVKIKLQAYDILSAIRQAQGYNRPFAVVGYDDMTSGAEVICGLLNYNTQIVTVKSEAEFKDAITELKHNGYDLIVGGTLASGIAERIGLTGITIISGDKSIEDAIKEGINIFNAYRKKTTEADLLRQLSILNPTKAYLFDEQCRLVYGDADNEELCAYLKEQCPKLKNGNTFNTIAVADGIRYLIEGRIISSDNKYFAFYTSVKGNDGNLNEAAVKISGKDDINYYFPDITYGSSIYMGRIIKNAKKALSACMSVIIEGDGGTEKDELAGFVFKNSSYCDGFLVSADLSMVSADDIEKLFAEYTELFAESKCVLYLKNAEAASKNAALKIIDHIDKYRPASIISLNLKHLSGSSTLIDYFRDGAEYTVLKIPPLAERREDINNFARMFIAELNLKTANSNIGLDDDAAQYLEEYDWPGNLKQLKRVITKAAGTSEKYYLSADDLKAAVDEDEILLHEASGNIDLSGSLKEITKEIISVVLEEEKGSKVRTAERLQISRSKLWSILKDSTENG